jgi:predicted transcriptional regulator
MALVFFFVGTGDRHLLPWFKTFSGIDIHFHSSVVAVRSSGTVPSDVALRGLRSEDVGQLLFIAAHDKVALIHGTLKLQQEERQAM